MQTERCFGAWYQRRILAPAWLPWALIGGGLVARLPMLGFRSADWTLLISGWMRTLHHQGLQAFQHPFSDYSFPYLFVLWLIGHLGLGDLLAVKLFSIAIDATLATAVALLAHQLWPQIRPVAAGTVAFVLPTVTLNGALWGQCDGLYASATVFAILFACRERWALAGMLLGIALALKLQTVFVIPALLTLWWYRDRRIRSVASGVASFAALTLPPVLLGRPLTDVLGTYRDQAREYPALTLNAPNLYQWWPWSLRAGDIAAAALSVVAVAVIAGAATRGRLQARLGASDRLAQTAVSLCGFAAVLLPFVLPHMHERYFYLAEILAVVLAFGERLALLAAVLLQVATTLAYLPFLTQQTPVPLPIAAVFALAAVVALSVAAWRQLTQHAAGAIRSLNANDDGDDVARATAWQAMAP